MKGLVNCIKKIALLISYHHHISFEISVRSNGTNVEFEECTDIVYKNCPSLDRNNLQKKNCKKDHQCTQLDKTFRCEDGECWNITNVYR